MARLNRDMDRDWLEEEVEGFRLHRLPPDLDGIATLGDLVEVVAIEMVLYDLDEGPQ